MLRIITSSAGYQERLQICGVFKNKSLECIWLELHVSSSSEASKRFGSKNIKTTR